ncbi:MAG TPA: Holliday junction resolvase [Nanoarchaeota archaeon]|nr:Holliday junction resolvase [Nanoarchaeota archaeon]
MGGNQKGSAAERELVSMLWGSNFAAIRAAGSGVQRFYSPDVLASNGSKVLAIECKSTKSKYQYFEPKQVDELKKFADIFKAEPWLAVKFSSDWKFFRLEDIDVSGKNLVISKETEKAKMLLDIFKQP